MALGWLFGRRRLAHLHFVMYTRRGCHLCDAAWGLLRAEQRRHGFTLRAADVDADRELAARHGDMVPVVTVNGKVRFRGGVNRVLLARLLRAEAARAR
ncbi:MAG TPA: glutaredoxin family protein [Gemmataceae bacterium]|nr:glutaredoxin family protein [Gemmataceae bacterium]